MGHIRDVLLPLLRVVCEILLIYFGGSTCSGDASRTTAWVAGEQLVAPRSIGAILAASSGGLTQTTLCRDRDFLHGEVETKSWSAALPWSTSGTWAA